MKSFIHSAVVALTIAGLALTGCSKDKASTSTNNGPKTATVAAEAPPTFVLAISEYPSWSAFLAASELGIINKEPGKLGPVEKAYNVDIDLRLTDYDTCLTMAGTGKADAVALTNMDALIPAASIPSVVIMPTSTSAGADALIVPNSITSISQLRGKKVYMLAKSVSEYVFDRNLEKLGEDPKNFEVVNMDPQAAATAFQQRKPGIDAIMVWNPFVMDTLAARPDSHVLFDSTKVPMEVIDSIVAPESSLAKPGGDRFAEAVIATYYTLNKSLRAPATHETALMAIGAKFSNITDPAKMETIVTQTKFFGTAAEGVGVLDSPTLGQTMQTVQRVYKTLGVIDTELPVTVGATPAAKGLRFDSRYMKNVATRGY